MDSVTCPHLPAFSLHQPPFTSSICLYFRAFVYEGKLTGLSQYNNFVLSPGINRLQQGNPPPLTRLPYKAITIDSTPRLAFLLASTPSRQHYAAAAADAGDAGHTHTHTHIMTPPLTALTCPSLSPSSLCRHAGELQRVSPRKSHTRSPCVAIAQR